MTEVSKKVMELKKYGEKRQGIDHYLASGIKHDVVVPINYGETPIPLGCRWIPGLPRRHMESNLIKVIVQRCPIPPWLRRLGIYGFLFFLLKGVAWLTLPALLVMMGR